MKIAKIEHIHYAEEIPVYDVVNAGPNHNFCIAGQSGIQVLHNCGFLQRTQDEVNFAPGSNTFIEKSKIMQTYSSVKARIKSRFIKNGKLLGKIFLVSSKRAENDFLEVYLQKRRKEADAGKLFIVDHPLWEVKPSTTYSGKKFQVAYGAKQLTPKVVEPGEDLDALRQMGFQILDVPVEFEGDFRFNIVTALQDLAGVALPGTMSYFSYKVFSKCYCERPNPFTAEVLQIGLDDAMEYEQFFDISVIPKRFFEVPMAIHVDTSLKNDVTGITGACYMRNVIADTDDGVVEKRVYAQVFSVGIKAPPGSEISMAKTRRFIYFLRRSGFHIVVVSTDTFQSAEFHQILKDKGFNTQIKSLDRTPEGYHILREAMVENRIEMIRHAKLENELIFLQRDTGTGKLDHPPDGSKDISDSLAGAIWDLSLLPYDPGMTDLYIGTHDKDDIMPASISQGLFGGLQEYDKYSFDRV